MKFKTNVAVVRDGKIVYWTAGANARRLVLSGLAKRRGQTMIELPGIGSPEDLGIQALSLFDSYKPDRHDYGSHTSANKDRKTYAPCFYRAKTGWNGTMRGIFVAGSNYFGAFPSAAQEMSPVAF